MDISIGRATAGDTKGIAELFDDYRVFFGEPSDLPLAAGLRADRLRHTESVIFRANTGGTVRGVCPAISEFLVGPAGRVWILNDLFVTESARGMGTGTNCSVRSRRSAPDANAKSILVETTSSNTGAQKLFMKQPATKK